MKLNVIKSLIIVIATTLFSYNTTSAKTTINHKSTWMSMISDTTPMCKISIPGSHDSGATKGGPMLETQDISISDQLANGVRAFDIRLQEKEGKLGVFHSIAFQDITWENDVLPTFIGFLKAHPSETLVVSLKREGGSPDDYSSLLRESLLSATTQKYIVQNFNPNLTLQNCRGKILFIHRDHAMDAYPGASASGWDDNCLCTLSLKNKDGVEGKALLQDAYQYSSHKEADKKYNHCVANFEKIAREPANSNIWGISYISATGLPEGTPIRFANILNKKAAKYVKKHHKQNYGIVFIDFTGDKNATNLIDNLIQTNLDN